jgi:hypothetical protein
MGATPHLVSERYASGAYQRPDDMSLARVAAQTTEVLLEDRRLPYLLCVLG